MSIDELIVSFRQLGKDKTLSNDVAVILDSWRDMREHLDFFKLVVRPMEFPSVQALYDIIAMQLSDRGCCMMELMPYIDDYLEYYEEICADFSL